MFLNYFQKRISREKIICIFIILLLVTCCFTNDNIHISIYNKTTYDLQINIFFNEYNYLKEKETIVLKSGNSDSFYLSSNNIVRSKAVVKIINNNIVKNFEYIDLNSIVNNIEFIDSNNKGIINILNFNEHEEYIKYIYSERGVSFYSLKITNELLNLDNK